MRWLLILLLSISWQFSFAGDQPVYHPIDKETWKKVTDGVSYYEEEEKVESTPEDFQVPTPAKPISVSPIVQIIGIVLIAALLAFIIWKLFGNIFTGNKKVDAVIINSDNELDDRPMETDLERYLREALERGDFRMAVRIYYLMLLKALHDGGKIEWRKEKTNRDYLIELYQHPQFHRLNNSTLVFEYVWYGECKVDSNTFSAIKPGFVDLIQKVSQP